ncbi:DeoR family transcriptional regulator [Cytobacillus oceanisediminis]|uniref:DeoR family transcriptional regulator n=1 Tax=Cytobacillus oceanisediminis TaxID=665099 RepID=UPI003734E7AD
MIEESHMKTMRILSLFERLSQGEVISKEKEAENFNVSVKTIQRDLKEINTYFSSYKFSTITNSIIYNRKAKGYMLKFNKELASDRAGGK